MLIMTRCRGGVFECSRVYCHVVGQIFVLAILAFTVTSTLADPLTLCVVEATPGFAPSPSIVVRLDDEGRKAFAQFTTEHVGEVVEFLLAGRVLTAPRVVEPIRNGIFPIPVGAEEIVEVANRLTTEGRIEVNAIGPPRR
jgi:hypothetical protein